MDTQFLQGEKYLWQLPHVNQQAIADVAARFNLSFPLAHTLLTRGFTTQEDISSFYLVPLKRMLRIHLCLRMHKNRLSVF